MPNTNKIRTAGYFGRTDTIPLLREYTFGPGNGVGAGQRSADLT